MRIDWTRTVNPVIRPISTTEAKQQARIPSDDEIGLIQSYIDAATQAAEDYLGRGLLTQTWKLNLDRFADILWLPMAAPLQSVTSVKYYDTTGTQQTLATSVYDVDTVSRPGRILLKAGQSWPAVQGNRLANHVEVIYVVGWTTADTVPERIKQGIRCYVSYLFEDRDGLDDATRAKAAAEACWEDRIIWREPEVCAHASQ